MREDVRKGRLASERMDVLDEIPRGSCQVPGCSRQAHYEWAGEFGTRWLCSRHRPLYREHDRILARIRGL
jgi:hypothetical protein